MTQGFYKNSKVISNKKEINISEFENKHIALTYNVHSYSKPFTLENIDGCIVDTIDIEYIMVVTFKNTITQQVKSLITSNYQFFYTQDDGMIMLDDLKLNAYVLSANYKNKRLESIWKCYDKKSFINTHKHGKIELYSLITKNENFFVEGILVKGYNKYSNIIDLSKESSDVKFFK